jgi:YYY domain-containing protein
MRFVITACVFVLFFGLGMKYLGTDDFSYLLRWWMTILVIGLAMQPFTAVAFKNFADGGWVFGKTIGIGVAGWLMWVLSSAHILKFSRGGSIACIVIVCAAAFVFLYFSTMRKNRNISISSFYNADRLCSIFTSETIFFALLVFWCYLKGISPDAIGTERYMDYGYMMSMNRSDYMPAADMWFAGEGINYYYIGQFLMTYINKIAGVPVSCGYNLAMMFLAAISFPLAYSIGNNLMHIFLSDRAKRKWSPQETASMQEIGCVISENKRPFFRPAIAGTLSGLAVTFAGNMHYPIYKYIYPKLQRLHGEDSVYSYWFPDATRYIGYQPDLPDKTIHEFPIYSFTIGDLHAHVINMIFVLTVLALLLAWLCKRKKAMDLVRVYDAVPKTGTILKETFDPALVLCAFFVGLFHTTNYWDFPIYFVVCGAVILFSNLVIHRFRVSAWILTAYQAAMFLVIGALVALPFTLTFDSIASGIGICTGEHHTKQFQLAVLWGLPNLAVWSFLGFRIAEHVRSRKNRHIEPLPKEFENDVQNVPTKPTPGVPFEEIGGKRGLGGFLSALEISDLYLIVIGLCAFGLVLLPEIIYVRDIYTGSYVRANTMFKLTYQAFIMFGLSMAFIITRFVSTPVNRAMKAIGIVLLFLFMTTVGYFNEAYTAWFGGKHQGLDASTFIRDDVSAAEADVIDYINATFDKQYTVLEMSGLSYTYFNRVSTFTGMPTVLGWQTHEWLWRSSGDISEYPKVVDDRHKDVLALYESRDLWEVSTLVEKYDIDYVFIGLCERVDGYYEVSDASIKSGQFTADQTMTIHGKRCKKIDLNTEIWLSLGEVVKSAVDEKTQETIYLIKVNRDLTKANIR